MISISKRIKKKPMMTKNREEGDQAPKQGSEYSTDVGEDEHQPRSDPTINPILGWGS